MRARHRVTQIEISNGDRTLLVDAGEGEGAAAAIAEALQAGRSAPSRVEITNGGRQIVVEADADMTDVAGTALQLYRDTDNDADGKPESVVRLGFRTGYREPTDDPETRAARKALP